MKWVREGGLLGDTVWISGTVSGLDSKEMS